MLRISIAETATEQRWTLEGRLEGLWVGELRACWKKRHQAQNGRTCTVDLSEVTSIDKSGVRLLRSMSKEGARFVATGIYTKHVLEELKTNKRRGPFNWILCLFAGFLASVIACSLSTDLNPELCRANARQEFRARLSLDSRANPGTSDFADGPGGTPCPHS
jgi:ABC-type transporter Mla MlaB component